MKPRVVRNVLLVLSFVLAAQGQTLPSRTGGVRGTTFTTESGQERTFVPGARLRIQCSETALPIIDVNTDEIGRFSANELPPGRYRISVEVTGIRTPPLDVVVEPDKVTEVEIEFKLASVKEEITVSAQAEVLDTSETASKAVLQESTFQHAPNINERFDSLLPLLPGVVRGPDGLINMKGARTSQSGMLLNSANVTDPVTGSSGINLPIDVVSTAQVVSATYIGITAFSRRIAAALFDEIGAMVAEGHVNDFFNAAVQRLVERGLRLGFSFAGGLPWAEIDDTADLQFARSSVYPRLRQPAVASPPSGALAPAMT